MGRVIDDDQRRPGVPFLKGHGTENDFVLIPDPDGRLDLDVRQVARLCHRRAGIGGDGLLRVVRSSAHPEGMGLAARAEWFMDYRNADGSIAEMCGNGIRVFARYLVRAGLAPAGDLVIVTRAGLRTAHVPKPTLDEPFGDITVDMGRATLSDGPDVMVAVDEHRWPAHRVDMGNPHAVAFVDDLVYAGDLLRPPVVTPAGRFPSGVNVEFAVHLAERHLAMRVFERGSGETRSCGTGACAVMVAAARRDGVVPAMTGCAVTYTVDVPGGRLEITERPDGGIEMTGPAVLVAEGVIDGDWLLTCTESS